MKVIADLHLLARFEAEGYRVLMRLFAPGTVFAQYCLCAPRIDAVLCGRLRLVIDGEASLLGPGDWIEVPEGVAVSAEVIGDEPVLELDAARD